jgi:hypothetical protein
MHPIATTPAVKADAAAAPPTPPTIAPPMSDEGSPKSISDAKQSYQRHQGISAAIAGV